MSMIKTVNKVSRWPSAFVVATGTFTPLQQLPVIHSETTTAVWPAMKDNGISTCTETQELLADGQFMEKFNAGLNELESGQGLSWEEAQKELDA